MTIPDQNAPFVVIPAVTRNQFWGILVMFAGAYVGLLYVLITVVLGGIDTRLEGIDSRIKSLEDHFQSAIVAGANVKQLLETAPTLQHDITETNKTVFELKGSMESIKTVSQQIQTLQQDLGKLQIQTNNIQKQIHTIS
jgi:archaellum component FlaC